MTLQEQFNISVAGLAAQGFEQSRDDAKRMCMYRSPDGKKCAIGHLITDDAYDHKMEAAVASAVIQKYKLPIDEVLACQLQSAHDGSREPQNMKDALRYVAERFSLKIPEALQ